MCLKISKTPVVALILSMFLQCSIKNSVCEDQNDWTPLASPSHESLFQAPDLLQLQNASNIVPVISEPVPTSTSSSLPDRTGKNLERQNSHKSEKASRRPYSKLRLNKEEDNLHMPMPPVQQYIPPWSSGFRYFAAPPPPPSNTRKNRRIYEVNSGDSKGRADSDMPEEKPKQGVIEWLSRLIGVHGETLGEFLRSYQVHVFYEFAFNFFKWIFFLYAGLIIP